MAIDYGTKRVGLAVSDPLKLIATALDTIQAQQVMAFLIQYHQQEGIEAFVLGLPKHLDGSPTDATQHVEGFASRLRKQFPDIPLHLVDERFTSKIAQQALIAGGMKKKDRQKKENTDKVAAVILLQDYMQAHGPF